MGTFPGVPLPFACAGVPQTGRRALCEGRQFQDSGFVGVAMGPTVRMNSAVFPFGV